VRLEYVIGGLLLAVGLVSAARSLGRPPAAETGRDRFLIAVHEAAKAMFWISLGGFFFLYAAAEEQEIVRWLGIVPIVMAAVRLLTATYLSRS
jgi:hypothetical protein